MRLYGPVILLLATVVLGNQNGEPDVTTIECPATDTVCAQDKFGYLAIHQLHELVDDDRDGSLDRSESDEFIRDELKYEDGFDRHSKFHGSDDLISVNDLWSLWTQSDVYNWTVDDTLDWLVSHVDLPQYEEKFKVNAVDGHTLPRIAANPQYITNILGIKNGLHKQLLALKSMDAVLFGPPKQGHNYIKDLALVASLVIAVGGCWLAYVQHRYSQSHLRKVMKDLDNLQKAEDALTDLQLKLNLAEEEQKYVAEEKKTLEKKMKEEIIDAKSEAERLRTVREATEEEISRLRLAEEELVQVRMALRRAEQDLEEQQHANVGDLQQWLQLTYELESKHYEVKREGAERHLLIAKEMYEKLGRQRGTVMGALRIAHNGMVDKLDAMLMVARSALEEVKMDLQERSNRWRQMEKICGFNIVTNPGIPFLESYLRGGNSNLLSSRQLSSSMMAPCGLEEGDEDLPPGFMTAQVAFYNQVHSGRPVTPVSGRTEPQVWPNLMKAGMQLTMFGLGMTNHRAMAPMGLMAGELRDRRTAKLAAGISGSSGSLSSMPSTSGSYAGAANMTRTSPLSTISSKQVSDPGSKDVSESDESPSVASTAMADQNGGPQFFLGEKSGTNGTRHSLDDLEEHKTDVTFKHSTSMEVSNPNPLPRPKTLPSSLSESAVLGKSGMARSQTGVHQRTALSPSPGTPSFDEHSSHESNDSLSLDDSTEKGKKKKKKRLLGKLLGRKSSDKVKLK